MSKLVEAAAAHLSLDTSFGRVINEQAEDSEVTKKVEKHDPDALHASTTSDGHHVYYGGEPGIYYVHHKASGKTHGVNLDPEDPHDKVSKSDAEKIGSKKAVAAIHRAHREEYGE